MTTWAMIDIETLATSPEALVLSVGAVKFDPYSENEPYDLVHYRLDINQQVELGREISEDTLAWWSKQDSEIREAAFSDHDRIQLDVFFKDLNKWVNGCTEIWCQGPQFDMVILENLYKQNNHHTNWAFWQIRDSRTLFSIMPRDPRKDIQTDLHNAAADAYFQAKCVQTSLKHFGVNKNQ